MAKTISTYTPLGARETFQTQVTTQRGRLHLLLGDVFALSGTGPDSVVKKKLDECAMFYLRTAEMRSFALANERRYESTEFRSLIGESALYDSILTELEENPRSTICVRMSSNSPKSASHNRVTQLITSKISAFEQEYGKDLERKCQIEKEFPPFTIEQLRRGVSTYAL